MKFPTPTSNEEADLQSALLAFSEDYRCPLTIGPANAFFRTVPPGGIGLTSYKYEVLTEGGPKPEGHSSGNGCETYEQAKEMFIRLLIQHTKRDFPIIIRNGPHVEQQDGRWRIYFRYVQLDFQADAILIELPLH